MTLQPCWWQSYVGEPYIDLKNDCMALAVRVARDLFKRQIASPSYAPTVRDQARALQAHKDEVCIRTETPKDGDPVLFLCRRRFYHIGVYVRTNFEDWILHADQGCGQVVMTRLKDMPAHGFTFEGFYQWK